jgi:Flp pilus assembly protein TadG
MATMTKNKSPRVARVWGRCATCERGDTLVEFALGLTLFLAIVFGTIELGLAVWQNNMLSNLAQEGARRASVCGTRTGLTSTECDIIAFVKSRSVGIDVQPVVTPTDVSTLTNGATVKVEVTTTFPLLTKLIPIPQLVMKSTAQMIVSR